MTYDVENVTWRLSTSNMTPALSLSSPLSEPDIDAADWDDLDVASDSSSDEGGGDF